MSLPQCDCFRPGFLWNTFANDAYLEGLADCVDEGLTQAVGVSNFNEERLRSAHRILAARGVPLASNQVQYSLLYRKPESNGVLKTCKELGVTLCAYAPLSQGVLTGKLFSTYHVFYTLNPSDLQVFRKQDHNFLPNEHNCLMIGLE